MTLTTARKILGVMSVAPNSFGDIGILPPKIRGHVTLAMSPFWKKNLGSCPYCPW